MKMFKKIGILFMSLCLCIPCFSMVLMQRTEGFHLQTPQTAVGEMVTVDCAVRSTSAMWGMWRSA